MGSPKAYPSGEEDAIAPDESHGAVPLTAVPGVILAGGLATRMGGGDKALLTLAGASLLERVVARLEPQVAALALSANGDAARFAPLDLPVLPDSVPGFPGPLAGILAGLDWAAARGDDAIVSAAADTPFLPGDLVARLSAEREGDAPVLAAVGEDGMSRDQPVFGLWPVALREALRDALVRGERKVGAFARAQGARRAMFTEPAAFFNINTPEDLARAEGMLS